MEVWKDIEGTGGKYQVSDMGNVRSWWGGKWYNRKLQVGRKGYLTITLHIDGQNKCCFVHRLVAESFLGKDDRQVNHKDENKQNNHLSNFEYATPRENTLHASKNEYVGVLKHKYKNGTIRYQSKICLDGNQVYLGQWDKPEDAEKAYLKVARFMGVETKYSYRTRNAQAQAQKGGV